MRTAGNARDEALQQELEAVRQAITVAQQRPLTINDFENPGTVRLGGYGTVPAITLDQVEGILTTNQLTKDPLQEHPDFAHTYYVEMAAKKTSQPTHVPERHSLRTRPTGCHRSVPLKATIGTLESCSPPVGVTRKVSCM